MPVCGDPNCRHCGYQHRTAPPEPKKPESTDEIRDAVISLIRQLGDTEMLLWANDLGAQNTLDALDLIASEITIARHNVYEFFPWLKPEEEAPVQKENNTMTETTNNVHTTSFGMFAPCDRPTYKKLKRIRHLLEQVCKRRNAQFARYWRKARHNRVIRDKKAGTETPLSEPKLFAPFFEKVDLWARIPSNLRKYYNYSWNDTDAQSRWGVESTQLLKDFLCDHASAKRPVVKVEDVIPLRLSVKQIDALLAQIEEYAS